MRRFIFISLLGSFLLLFSILFWMSPSLFYWSFINHHLPSFIYHDSGITHFWLDGEKRTTSFVNESVILEKYWRYYQIGDLRIQLPIRYPLLRVIPLIKWEKGDPNIGIGFQFLNNAHRFLLEIKWSGAIPFKRILYNHPWWKTPLFVYELEKIPLEKIWVDLFSLNLTTDFYPSLYLSWEEILYRLYILYLRNHYFPPHTKSYYFNPDKNHAFILFQSKSAHFRFEQVLFFRENHIFNYDLRSVQNLSDSQEIKNRLINTTTLTMADQEMITQLYKNFQQLPFKSKIGEEGMFFLFSAWSQKMDDVELLRDLIRFMERGEDHLEQLHYFYSYALKRYGTDFSAIRGEKDGRIMLDPNDTVAPIDKPELQFKNDRERTEYYMKKAKEKGPPQKKKNTLIFD